MNRRKQARTRHRLRVRVEPGTISTVTGDLSPGGVFVYSHRMLQPGTRVRFEIELPGGVAEAEGVVRWAKRVPPHLSGVARGGMGIEFTRVSDELHAHLAGSGALLLRAV